MNIAVTGISGYLGGVVARKLHDDPRVESILGLDIAEPRPELREALPKMHFEKADVLTADFEKLFAGLDAVYHLAFIVETRKGMTMEMVDRVNIEGSRRVFESAAKAGVPRIVYSSSVAAYGAHRDNPSPLTEAHPLRPNKDWYYSRGKGAVEKVADEVQARHPDLILIRFRPCTFLGPTIRNVMGYVFRKDVVGAFRNAQPMDLAWDEDIADAFALALDYDRSDAFNLAAEGPKTIAQFALDAGKQVRYASLWYAKPLARLAGLLGMVAPGAEAWVTVSTRGPLVVDTSHARDALGWRPKYTAQEALDKYAAGFKS
ncbi:MAG: NAD-dependent epimerase/dehydratase family protein [Deltaproteobacteria bacterium]|nr:NAD-dependent epimerase/dehydratase family protein [Deltaproteobacteria bacterium]MCB9479987.1 NAD-dependent epimerase/dehydratase family protein [Deltaproteobacteria bacterium]